MTTRKKATILLILSLILTVSLLICTACAAYTELRVPRYQQEQSKWCWVAAAKMAGDFVYTPTYTQSEIVEYIKGSVVNETGSISETAESMELATGWVQHANYTSQGNPWTFQNFMLSIRNQRPVVPLVNDGLTGHYYVVCGYEESTERVALIDPGTATRYTCSWDDFNDGDTSSGWIDNRPHVYTCYFSDWSTMRTGKAGENS